MNRLGNDFIRDMNLENVNNTDRGIACEMLHLCLEQYEGMSDVDFKTVCYVDEVLEDITLTRVLDLAGYWSNNLAAILVNNLKGYNIDTPLLSNINPYRVINSWLENRGILYKTNKRGDISC